LELVPPFYANLVLSLFFFFPMTPPKCEYTGKKQELGVSKSEMFASYGHFICMGSKQNHKVCKECGKFSRNVNAKFSSKITYHVKFVNVNLHRSAFLHKCFLHF
jgi:hypothetical protein